MHNTEDSTPKKDDAFTDITRYIILYITIPFCWNKKVQHIRIIRTERNKILALVFMIKQQTLLYFFFFFYSCVYRGHTHALAKTILVNISKWNGAWRVYGMDALCIYVRICLCIRVFVSSLCHRSVTGATAPMRYEWTLERSIFIINCVLPNRSYERRLMAERSVVAAQ